MEFVTENDKEIDNRYSDLILPVLSIGNAGQLAMDLLIASLQAERVGYFDDPYVLPCVGNDAYGPVPDGELALPLEGRGMMVKYAKHIADFAATSGKKRVIVLSSLDFGRWQSIDLSRCLTYLVQYYDPKLRSWEYLLTLAETNDVQDISSPFEDDEDEDYYPSLPFAALFSCIKAKGLRVTCLLCYCSEGDNIPEALHLADAARKYLALHSKEGVDITGWIVPCSWNTFYEPPSDMSLF